MNETPFPKTLTEAVQLYADPDVAHAAMTRLRWPDGVKCPRCGSDAHYFVATRRLWQCKGCKRQFTVKVGSLMEDSPIAVGKWLTAMWLIANAKNSISSHEIGRALGITQKSAWFLAHRIRHAMQGGSFERLTGAVEVDEMFLGAVGSKMNRAARFRSKTKPRGPGDKTITFTAVQRGGRSIARVVGSTARRELQRAVRATVAEGSKVYSDENAAYDKLDGYEHEAVNHSKEEWVRGDAHTQNVENYHSLFKRCVRGTWVNISPEHTNRYLAEQDFRYSERKGKDGERARLVAGGIAGRRLTYRKLTARRVGRGPAKGYDWRAER